MARSDSRERILDAAERLFAEKGVAATSLREIGAQAQANPGSIYFHWKTKVELVRDVFRRRLAPLDAERVRRLDAAERARAPEPAPLAGRARRAGRADAADRERCGRRRLPAPARAHLQRARPRARADAAPRPRRHARAVPRRARARVAGPARGAAARALPLRARRARLYTRKRRELAARGRTPASSGLVGETCCAS